MMSYGVTYSECVKHGETTNKEIDTLKALRFREDLIDLLNAYDCSISGTHIDNGDINLEFNFGNYVMQDNLNSYNIRKENLNGYENIIDNFIIDCFPTQKEPNINNIKTIGVFTKNSFKVGEIFAKIYENTDKKDVTRLVKSVNHIELDMVDGTTYKWIRPDDASRGHRCSGAIIDRELTLKELREFVFPTCVHCSKDTVEIF